MIARRTGTPDALPLTSNPRYGRGRFMDAITVLIADDQAELRAALVDLVSADDRLELIGQARDADEAISLVTRHRPDVALVDVRMPSGGGLRATRAIRIVSPRT